MAEESKIIMQKLDDIKSELDDIKKHMVDVDMVLTDEDIGALEEAEKDLKKARQRGLHKVYAVDLSQKFLDKLN